MTTATQTQLWTNQNTGEVACGDHGGSYLAGEIAAHPVAFEHVTPLGTWLRVNGFDREWWLKEVGAPMTCETCGKS